MDTLFDLSLILKTCADCKLEKLEDEFYFSDKILKTRFAICIPCHRRRGDDVRNWNLEHPNEKKCLLCGNARPRSDFKTKRSLHCSECAAGQPKRLREGQDRWYQELRKNHPEICKEKRRQNYLRNKEKMLARTRDYRLRNMEKDKATDRAWRQNNKEKINAYTRNRVALLKNAEGTHTAVEWLAIKTLFGRCLKCGVVENGERMKKLEPDHVDPVTKGGSNWITNIQPLCRTCNISKGNKKIDYRPANWMELYGKALESLTVPAGYPA